MGANGGGREGDGVVRRQESLLSGSSRGGRRQLPADVKSVDNNEVIFDNKGNPIFLS